MNGIYYRYYFLAFMSWSCTYTMITVFFNEGLGIPATTVGVFMSFIPVITMIFQPFWGAVSDKSGNRKRILTQLMVVTMTLMLAFTQIDQMWLAFFAYALFMMFLAGQNPISDGMSINYVNMEEDSASYGVIRSWGSIGYAFGAFAVARIADYFGIRMIFYFAALGYILSIIQMRSLNTYDVPAQRRSYWHDLKALLQNKRYVYLITFTFLLIGSFFAGEQYIFMYTRKMGISMTQMGAITSLSVLVEIPFIFYSRKLIVKFGAKKMLWLITLADITRMIILSMSHSFALFMLAGIVRGIFVGSFIPFFIDLISRMTKSHLVTSGIAIYSAASTGLGAFVFTMVGSVIAATFNYRGMYLFFAMIAIINVMMLFKIRILIEQRD